MKKGILIFLGVMVGALMFTSLLSAVNSEISIAKNAALSVTSHPVIATDRTLSELEPEKYDSMIDTFRANTMKNGADAAESTATAAAEEPDTQEAIPDSPETAEAAADTPAELADNNGADEKSEMLPLAASAAIAEPAVPVDSARDDKAGERDITAGAEEATKTVSVEATPERSAPERLYADARGDHDTPRVPELTVATGEHTVFTIQAGSFSDRLNAEKKYESLTRAMAADDLHNLRIEKVGQYYTVRLGRFDHYVTAMKFLNAMHEKLTSAIVLNAYIKNERIVQLYNHAMLAGK